MKNTKLISGTSRSLGLLGMADSGHGFVIYTAEGISKYIKYSQYQVTCGNFGYYVKETEMQPNQPTKSTTHHKTAKMQQTIMHIHKHVTQKVLIKTLTPIYPTAWSTLIAPLQVVPRVRKRLVSAGLFCFCFS